MSRPETPQDQPPGTAGHSTRPILGASLVASSTVFFAGTVVIGKFALDQGRSIIHLLTIRSTVGTLLLLLLLVAKRRPLIPIRRERFLLPMLATLIIAAQVVFYGALQKATAALASLIFFTYPTFVALMWWALRRGRPERRTWVAVCSAFVGTTWILGSGSPVSGSVSAVSLALLSALMYATYIVFVQLAMRATEYIAASVWTLGTGTLIMVALSLIKGETPFFQVVVPPSQWLPPVAMGVANAIGFVCLLAGLSLLGPVRAAILGAAEPLVVAIMATVVLQEPLGLEVIIGGGFIVAAVVLSSSRPVPAIKN